MVCAKGSLLLFSIFINSRGFADIVVALSVGICAGLYLFYRGFRLLAQRRLIENTPASKIRSASVGLVELSGLAEGPRTVQSPITSLNCYFYRSLVWEWIQSGKSGHWEKVVDEQLHVPFYLNDNTGRILIEPEGAELDIHRDFHEEYNNSIFGGNDLSSNVGAFLVRHGVSTSRKLKIEEYCIKPKNALFVLGTLATNPGLRIATSTGSDSASMAPNATLLKTTESATAGSSSPMAHSMLVRNEDTGTQEVIRLSGNPKPATTAGMTQQGKIAAAMMKAGITNPVAWEVAGVPYPDGRIAETQPPLNSNSTSNSEKSASIEKEDSNGFDAEPATVLMKGEHNAAFFISWRSQREVVRSLGWKSTLMIWGGPVLTLGSLYGLARFLGWIS